MRQEFEGVQVVRILQDFEFVQQVGVEVCYLINDDMSYTLQDDQLDVLRFSEETTGAHENAFHYPRQTSWLKDELLCLFCFCYP